MLTNKRVLHQVMIGVILALLIYPPHMAQAQWTVYDPLSDFHQVIEFLEDADRWIQTVEHYVGVFKKYDTMIQHGIQQVTSLGGILTTVDEQLARHKSLVKDIARMGQTVRDAFELERQLKTMVTTKIGAIKKIQDRLDSGILDPSQDKRDLEEYLKYSIGRSSQQVVDHQVYLAESDAEYNEILYQTELIYTELAKLRERMMDLQGQLTKEQGKSDKDQQVVSALIEQITGCEVRYDTLSKRLDDLNTRKHAKEVQYGVILEEHINFAKTVARDMQVFQDMTKMNDTILDELGKIFDPTTEQKVDKFDRDLYDPYFN